MAVDSKKEKEREEVHRAIWAIADELRTLRIMFWVPCSTGISLKT